MNGYRARWCNVNALTIPSISEPGEAPDPATALDATAITVAASAGFVYVGTSDDLSEIYAHRPGSNYVDFMSLSTDGKETSAASRIDPRDVSWAGEEWPSPERTAAGSLREVVQQVIQWPV